MNLPNPKFCVLPWISLETSPIGTVRPCCLAEEEIVDDAGRKFSLLEARFSVIQNSQYMQGLRKNFLAGVQPDTCRKCWAVEDAGGTSKRMHTLDRLKHVVAQDQPWTEQAKPLQFLDLKLGNICNLKCRICGSWSSSTFATEELANIPATEKKFSPHYAMLRAGAWPRNNPTFWDEIEQVVDQVHYIEFTGGEPFLIQEHFDLLKGLVDRGVAHNIEIHYNTNATQYPEHAPDIWQHFKLVEIAFSIDDIGPRFEYQRSGAQWTVAQDTIHKFFTLKRQRKNFQLQVCATVNAFNVYYLPELAAWLDTQPFDLVYWNILHEAAHFSVSTLPDSAKTVLAQRLLTADVKAQTQQEFVRIVEFMLNGTSDNSDYLISRIQELDARRAENLQTVEPEFADLIGYRP